MKLKLIASLFAAVALAGCGGGNNSGSTESGSAPANSTGDIVIGVAVPLTGDNSEYGVQIRRGAELLVDKVNADGGINGRKLALSVQDDGGKAEQAQTVATTLADNANVVGVIGHYNSSCSLAGKMIYEKSKLVMLSPGSTNVDVTADSQYIFRNIFTDEFQGQSLARYAHDELGKKNAAILYENDDYGTGLKDSFKKEAAAKGLNIVQELAYNRDTPDFRSQLTTIQAAQPAPDVLLIAGLYSQAANIARQARAQGLQVQVIGGEGVFSQEFIKLGGPAAEGAIITVPFLFDLGGEKGKVFADEFRKKYNTEADGWAVLSYDAASMFVEALKSKGVTREGLREGLRTHVSPETAFDGISGKTFFDDRGDCKRPIQVAIVKDGKFVAAEKQLSAQ